MGFGFNTSFPQYNLFPLGFGGTYSSAKTETEEEKKQRLKKEADHKAAEEFQKRLDTIKLRAESESKLKQQISELEQYSNDLNITIEKAKNGKESEDGTIKVNESWDDYKKLPFWKKGLRAASHLVQGTWKLATGFFGYETDEKTGESKWNWKKAVKNATIAAGCIALTTIPVVGPVISTGLLATGTVCGVIGTGKGIAKAATAKSPEELDNAFQDMGAGLTIGVSSALGLRGLGKGLQASSTTCGSTTIARSTSNNAVSQFIKDATINAYRATIQGVNNSKSAVGTSGFWKTYSTNLKNTIPKLGKTKYETTRDNTIQNINSGIRQIEQELNNSGLTPIQKAILENKKVALEEQLTELSSTITKSNWKNLKTDSKVHNEIKNLQNSLKDMQSNGSVEINGTTFNSNKENIEAIEQAIKQSKTYSKQIENLAKVRSATMKKMALYKRFSTEVESYTGNARNNRLGRLYDTIRLNKSDFTWKNVLLSPLKFLWNATMLPFKPWNYVQNSPTSTFYKIEETFIPEYEEGFLTSGFLADSLGMGKQTLKTTITQQDENGQNVEQEVAVTKEILAQLESEAKKANEEISKTKEELGKLYLA